MLIVEIPLTRGYFALVDAEDLSLVGQQRWYARITPRNVYALANRSRKERKTTKIIMHRVITGARKGIEVDHIDGNGLNNTRENLRLCTRKQNARNVKSHCDSNSKFLGVCKPKHSGRWRAQIGIGGKQTHIGYFDTEIEAAIEYDKKAIEVFGKFANLNFPEESCQ